jgi:cytochrome c6
MNTSYKAYRTLRLTALSSCLAVLTILPHSALAADPGNGQRLYLTHCAGCHGQTGLSTMPNAPNLSRSERLNQPDPVVVDKIRSGINAMPPFLGILKDNEIYDVVSYVRTLR